MKRVLVTGSMGQIGSELSERLGGLVGPENIVGLDLRPATPPYLIAHETVDITCKEALRQVIEKYEVDTVYHMASLLSARGEMNPDQTWEVNMTGLKNVLDLAPDDEDDERHCRQQHGHAHEQHGVCAKTRHKNRQHR